MNSISGLIHFFFFKVLDMMYVAPRLLVVEGRQKYHKSVAEKLKHMNLIISDYEIDDLGYSGENRIGDMHDKIANFQREKFLREGIPAEGKLPLECLDIFDTIADMPIVFIENYKRQLQNEKNNNVPKSKKPLTPVLIEPRKNPIEIEGNIFTVIEERPTLNLVELEELSRKQSTASDIGQMSKSTSETSPNHETIEQEVIKEESEALKSLVKSEQKAENIQREFEKVEEKAEPISGLMSDKVDLEGNSSPSLQARGTQFFVPERSQANPRKPGEYHLVVLVHGYEGRSFDMKLIKNSFSFLSKPDVLFHCACANETDSTLEIQTQGALLAKEISCVIRANFKEEELKRISFIGHSLGGLVVRAALTEMAQWKDIMYTYMSFGTPHIGCANNKSTLVKTGLNIFSKLKGHKSLNQINLTDHSDLKNCYLMKLSAAEGLNWFEHVILFSSHQDYYIPYESARIEYGDIEFKDKKRAHHFKRMVQNLLGRLKNNRLIRVDMNLKMQATLNAYIGRTAHIKILDSLQLQTIISYFFVEYID